MFDVPSPSDLRATASPRENPPVLFPAPAVFLLNRAVALANGRYLDPKTGQYREWIGGRPWGRGGGRATSAASSRSTTTSSTPAASDDSAPQKIYTTSYRATQARIAEYERQQAELADLKEDPPETRSFEQIDTRELEKTLFRQGYSIPQVKAAVAAAEEQNKQRRLTLAAIKKDIRERVPDPDKRDAELARVLAAIDKDHARQAAETSCLVQAAIALVRPLLTGKTFRILKANADDGSTSVLPTGSVST